MNRMFFSNRKADPTQLLYLSNYHPWRGGNNPAFDHFSGMILDLKQGKPNAIEYFFNILKDYFSDNFTIATVPSHDKDNKISSIVILAQKLAANKVNVEDGTSCLQRHTTIQKLTAGGHRGIETHLQSMDVKNLHIIRNKNVLLLDDVATTNNSQLAGKTLLEEAGANVVQAFSIAKTV